MTSQAPNRDLLIASLSRAHAHLAVLEILASFGIATTRQIARFRFDTPTVTQEQRTTRVLASLRRDRLVVTRPAASEIEANPRLRWFVPVHGLTDLGCGVARHYAMGDPKPFEAERSLLMLEHDLKVAEIQYRLERLCEREGWRFLSRQTDLNRTVFPDRLFGIDKGTGFLAVFHEEENKPKDFRDLYQKARRYTDYHDTDACRKEWGWFRKFLVTWTFGTEERMQNFVSFLAGECRCAHYRGRLKHTCLREGLQESPLRSPYLWFTHSALTANLGGRIWITPRDSTPGAHAFRDLLRGAG